ncbi:efflux RND transporter periplasmic adaptor subunit [Neolewinella aurantiaca]|uniref:Efflux RND transporter periplasmic adaptor subunit n=1 Tax=Neolewinella aurantiaca TaxID=2602767 RepID=A0A5C7FY60_9BACT|nr:efflux RND transporter periplasmic adaptor subunit [Neolewinella aurantiaca]TXF90541.1 efflux RND transporter periplasmic adaptor subunit [Neolewinella aurantiaca]
MDRKIDKSAINRKRNGRILKWTLLSVAVVTLAWFGLRALRPSADEGNLRFAIVETGDVLNTINATALVLPAFEEQVNAPVATTIKEVILTAGTQVQSGDILLRLDREYVGLQLDGRRDQLALKENSIGLLQLEYDRDLKELGFDAEIKELQLAEAEARLGDARRLLKVGGATEEEVEAAELAVKITRLEAEKLNNQLAYSRNSLAGRERKLQLEVGMEEKEVQQLSRKLRETDVRAPRAGVVTWVNENLGQQVAEGAPLARIANLGRYKIEGSCSDRYAEQLSVGMPVELRLPKAKLSGILTDILPEVTNNTIRFRVELDDSSDENLRPNLRAELNVITDKREGALRVKNGQAFRGGKRQSVFVVRGNEAIRTEIRTGLRNGDFVEIESGLKAGDKIVISDTEEYERMSSFQLSQ